MKAAHLKILGVLVILLNSGCQTIIATGWIKKFSWKIQGTCQNQPINLQGDGRQITQVYCSPAELAALRRHYRIEVRNGQDQKWTKETWSDEPPHWFTFHISEPVKLRIVNGKVVEISRTVEGPTRLID